MCVEDVKGLWGDEGDLGDFGDLGDLGDLSDLGDCGWFVLDLAGETIELLRGLFWCDR